VPRTFRPFHRRGQDLPGASNGSIAHANCSPFMLRTMNRILNSRDFDLVHVFEPTTPSVGASALLQAKVPVVGNLLRGGDATRYYRRWFPLAERLMACLSVKTAVSEAAATASIPTSQGNTASLPAGSTSSPTPRQGTANE